MSNRLAAIAAFVLASSTLHAAAARWTAVSPDVLKDNRTGLQWTRADNGAEIAWDAAQTYCMRLDDNWRLPRVEELSAIADDTKLFRLTGEWFWSASTPVKSEFEDADELAWGVSFANGARTPSLQGVGYGSRALCVRSAP